MDGRMPIYKTAGFGERTVTISIMIRAVNNRRTIENGISAILAKLTPGGAKIISLDNSSFANYFYGSLKSYTVNPIIKKRSQILKLTMTGVLYRTSTYRGRSDGSKTISLGNNLLVHRPCQMYLGDYNPSYSGTAKDDVVVDGLFFDPTTSEPIDLNYSVERGSGSAILIDGLTGRTGTGIVTVNSSGVPTFKNFSYEPLNGILDFITYPIIAPGIDTITITGSCSYQFVTYNLVA